MKWFSAIVAYAVIVFAGGTMQSVMNVPYTNPIKDGHEFTRDLMAGVVLKTAIDDVFAGIPMFGRYAGAMDFRKSAPTEPFVMADSNYIVNDSNKMREIGFLPALHFSADASELDQSSYEQPIEMFGQLEQLPFPSQKYSKMDVIGIAHSDYETYIIYKGKAIEYWDDGSQKNTYEKMYYANEKTPYDVIEAKISGTNTFINADRVFTYNGLTVLSSSHFGFSGSHTFRDNGVIKPFREGYSPSWIMGSFIIFTNNKVIDIETGDELDWHETGLIKKNPTSYEEWKRKFVLKLYEAKRRYGVESEYYGIGRFSYFPNYEKRNMRGFIISQPGKTPETVAMEMANNSEVPHESLIPIYQYSIDRPHERDISIYNNGSSKTFAYATDYKNFVDTGIDASRFYLNKSYRSHNYLYVRDGIKQYRIQLRQNKIYGDKPYIERGRSWQH